MRLSPAGVGPRRALTESLDEPGFPVLGTSSPGLWCGHGKVAYPLWPQIPPLRDERERYAVTCPEQEALGPCSLGEGV